MRRDLPEVGEVEGPPVLPAGMAAPDVIAALRGAMTDARFARITSVVAGRICAVVPVLENLADPHNAAAVLRTADAFGLQTVHVIEAPHRFVASHRVARGTDRWLDVVRFSSPAACARALHDRGFEIFVAAADGALTPRELRARDRVAVVLGNEHSGASAEMRGDADGSYRIPMRGFVESFNVSVAAAITLHALTEDRAGDLDDGAREQLIARFMMGTVRDAEQIVAEYARTRR